MPNIEIKSWCGDSVLYAADHDTLKAAVEAAVKAGADLTGADLRGANLRGANLRGADLWGADLLGADLWGADLWGANLWGADLTGANLTKIRLAYQSHDLSAEILRRAAGNDIEKLKIAGYILVSREKCWREFAALAATDPLGEWALDELAKWVQPDDGAPDILRERAETQHNQEAVRP